MFVILMGAQGSGKGTQAALIGPKLKLVKIATGDLFRSAIAMRTELGMQVQSIIESGGLVPDELTNAIVNVRVAQVSDELKQSPDTVGGALFDGFPRTEPQARALDAMLEQHGQSITAVVEISVPREKLIRRLAGRRTCETCGTVYHVESDPPKIEGVCDHDGGRLVQREDDTPDAITRRLGLYDELTAPLLTYYGDRGVLERVDGDQDVAAVEAQITEAIHRHVRAQQTT